MSRILKDLKPEKVFYYFEEISKIPRCSNHEKRISEFLYNWAKEKNLEVSQDKALNILIKKKASKGYENSPTVILQGHMDMVCEKNMDTQHDFSKDPLQLRIVDDYIYATGTTLGADNGIAVAFAMAILDSDDIVHPPLEVLITTDEENGMTGVENLDTKNINGKILINLDSEDEGIFTAGCAGGGRVKLMIPVEYKAPNYSNFYKLSIKGLKGGHSGVDIDKERGNSIKLLGRVLYNLKDEIEISSIIGGSKDNAIPRESQAIISCKEEEDLNIYE
jgi:dipeptidase D